MTNEPPAEVLDPDTTRDLVDLRLILLEGLERSSDPSPSSRRVGVILVDGACEAALAGALTHLGLGFQDTSTLNDLYSKLAAELTNDQGEKWFSPRWPHVRKLRRLRNDAQHHGIAPDQETLLALASDAEEFCGEVTQRVYGVGLQFAALALAIRDEESAAQILGAERLIHSGAYAEAVAHLREAFKRAVDLWAPQLDAEVAGSSFMVQWDDFSLGDRNTAELQREIEKLSRMIRVAPFASSLGEYVWFESLRKEIEGSSEVGDISESDAVRALVFVQQWIVRYERFSASYLANRGASRQRPLPPSSHHADGRPVLLTDRWECKLYGTGAPVERFEFQMQLGFGDGTSASAREWHLALQTAIRGHRFHGECSWSPDSGAITLRPDEGADLALVLDAVDAWLGKSVESFAQARAVAARYAERETDLEGVLADVNRRFEGLFHGRSIFRQPEQELLGVLRIRNEWSDAVRRLSQVRYRPPLGSLMLLEWRFPSGHTGDAVHAAAKQLESDLRDAQAEVRAERQIREGRLRDERTKFEELLKHR